MHLRRICPKGVIATELVPVSVVACQRQDTGSEHPTDRETSSLLNYLLGDSSPGESTPLVPPRAMPSPLLTSAPAPTTSQVVTPTSSPAQMSSFPSPQSNQPELALGCATVEEASVGGQTSTTTTTTMVKSELDDSRMEVVHEDKEVLAWLQEGLDQCDTVPKEEQLPEEDVLVYDAILTQEDDILTQDYEEQAEEDLNSDLPSTSSLTTSDATHHEYVVQYGDISVLIRARNKRSILRTAIRKLSKLQAVDLSAEECELEALHPRFKEYYLIVEEEDVPDSGVLRIRTGGTRLARQQFFEGEDPDEEWSLPLPPQSSKLSSEFINCGPHKEWPEHFELPTNRFSQSLRKTLLLKAPLDKSSEKELSAHLYDEIVKYTFYPTGCQTRNLITALFEKYPHLHRGLTRAEASRYWRLKISNKMRNLRRTRHKDVAVVLEKRNQSVYWKDKPTYAGGTDKPPCTPRFPVKTKSLKRPALENPETIMQHKAKMQRLHQENGPLPSSLEVVQTAMDATFSDRRYFILTNRPSVATIMDEFPCLFNPTQMLQEFRRLMVFSALDKMEASLVKHGKAIIELARLEGAFLASDMPQELPEEQDQALLVHRAILCIPFLVKEPVYRIGLTKMTQKMLETVDDSPVLTVEGDLTRAEGPLEGKVTSGEVHVCSVSGSLVSMMSVWVASCYALNRRYPIHGRRTLSFIETVLLDVNACRNTLLNNALKRKLNVALNERGLGGEGVERM